MSLTRNPECLDIILDELAVASESMSLCA
jgi:hypothetical protein